MTRHRWGEPVRFAHKTERECLNGCRTIKVSRQEFDGGRDVYWTEFWCDGDRIECAGTPLCEPVGATA